VYSIGLEDLWTALEPAQDSREPDLV
jgi:hypothetical protein